MSFRETGSIKLPGLGGSWYLVPLRNGLPGLMYVAMLLKGMYPDRTGPPASAL